MQISEICCCGIILPQKMADIDVRKKKMNDVHRCNGFVITF